MKIELDVLDAGKSQDFLNYFIAQLKEKNKSPFLGNASAGFNSSGQYETNIRDFIRTNDGRGTAIDWKITQNTDGTIPFVEAVSKSDIASKKCSDHINEFVNNVLKLTLSEKKETFFYRSYYCFIHGSNLNGEYWISPRLRIAPLYPKDDSKLINAERIIVIDQLVDAIDKTHSYQLGDERASLLSAQLSFLFDLGIYKPIREERWVISRNEDSKLIKNERKQLGIWDENQPDGMPNKGVICTLSTPIDSVYKHERCIGEDLAFPQETRKILKAVDATQYVNRLAFNRCCRLYQTALNAGRYHPTIKLSYMYGAIDSITQTTKNEKGFSEFMRKYYPSVTDEFLEFIHSKIRSAHWHSGEFIMGESESDWKETITNPDSHLRFNIIRNGHKALRTAILNWLFKEIVQEEPHITSE